jgi:hypothetical protein
MYDIATKAKYPMDLVNALAQYRMQLLRALRCDPALTFHANVCTYAARDYSGGLGFYVGPRVAFGVVKAKPVHWLS